MSTKADNKGLTLTRVSRLWTRRWALALGSSVARFGRSLAGCLCLASLALGHGLGMGLFGIAYLPNAEEQDQNENTQFEPDSHAAPLCRAGR